MALLHDSVDMVVREFTVSISSMSASMSSVAAITYVVTCNLSYIILLLFK